MSARQWLRKQLGRAVSRARAAALTGELRELERAGLVTIGRHTYGVPKIWSYKGSERKVRIGSFCSIAPEVEIITGGIHPAEWVSLFPFRTRWGLPGGYQDGMPTSRGDVTIGSDVWIGTGAMILSGVTIGDGALVAARAVVTKDLPPFAVAAGAPARVISMRFEPATIERLLAIRWWDWPEEKIRESVDLLSSPRVEEFLRRYG